MKSIDLMIGDWVDVYHELPDESGFYKPLQVTGTHYNDGVCFGHDVIKSPWIDPEEFEAVQPIPLTPEILEKNGFVPIRQNAGEPYYWQYFDKRDGSIVNAFRRIYRGLWIECSNATTEASTNKQCEFVHELQHALKLCGIEKEVVL